MNADVLISTQDFGVGYNDVAVVSNVDLSVSAGEVVALLGRNGAGKTTTLHTLAGLLSPICGSVTLFGKPATGPLQRRARNGLALVTEDRMIVRRLTVYDNLRLGPGDPRVGLAAFPELEPLRGRKAGLLSGGEQQMLVLARTLAARPRLMLVDELSFGLAPLIVKRLLDSLRSAARENGTAILLVEQQITAALTVADRGYVLADGKIAMQGTSDVLKGRVTEIEGSYLSTQQDDN
jgi:branched-chain amino acid transport system ATP-binding protein